MGQLIHPVIIVNEEKASDQGLTAHNDVCIQPAAKSGGKQLVPLSDFLQGDLTVRAQAGVQYLAIPAIWK